MNIKTEDPNMEDLSDKEEELAPFDQFQEQLFQLKKPEEKIRLSLNFMKQVLADKTSLRFRDFWESKKICLPFFKESLSVSSRCRFWSEYVEISAEGKQLKDLLDEQSAFIVEQLDLAINALEQDLLNRDKIIEQLPSYLSLDHVGSLSTKQELYHTLQQELYWLNTVASRINGFRKEIIKTEMRARIKNKFFERLSKVGDSIFPRRKELIKQVSEQFLCDVQAFAKTSFEEAPQDNMPIFAIKTEIKALQSIAKNLTLDTHSFNQTRIVLSECWDRLREKEEVFRQQSLQKKEEYKQALEKVSKEQEERNLQLEALQRQKRERIEAIRTEIQHALDSVSETALDSASQLREQLHLKVKALNPAAAEKELLDSLLKKLRDKILDKKEKALSNLSEEQQKSLECLRARLCEGQAQRSEIKTQIENYRKALSGSDFDFEKAMHFREMMDAEKLRLDKVNSAIEDIEDKIAAL
jgi:hypothetical protein